MFTKEEYVDWRSSKVTKTLLKILTENRQGKLEDLADGKARESDLYITLGQCQGLKDAVEFMLNLNGELQDLFLEEKKDA